MIPTPQSLRAFRRSGGFGLLQVMLLIAVLAGLSAMGYLQWSERSAVNSSRQELQALAQADRAIIAFATVMRRLPCPATVRDGVENCAIPTDQNGWLPSASLRLAGADVGGNVGQLRYMVQRQGGDNDLTLLSDAWTPLEYDEDQETFFAMRAGGYPTDILTLADLCHRLDNGRVQPVTSSLARVNSSPLRAIAYALAHPGSDDADGDGDLFDGANAAGHANLMEDPARRPLLARYNDIVLERSHSSLLSAFQCGALINSINVVALGHDVAGDVAEMRADNIESARRAVVFNTLAAIMTALEITLAVAEGASDAGNAAAEWVICAATLGLAVNACAAAPQHTVAIGLAGGVTAANGVAVGLTAKAAVTAGTALRLADSAATPDQICPPMDTAMSNLMLATAQREVTDANADLAGVDADIRDKTTELSNAQAARTAAIQALYGLIRAAGHSSQIDSGVAALLTAASGWSVASYNNELSAVKVLQATDQVNRLTAEVGKYNAMLADIPGTITRLTSEIAALDAQIAANPPNRTALEEARQAKDAELRLARNTAGLQAVRNRALADQVAAQTSLNDAIAARDAAGPAFANASMTYRNAYASLIAAASRYAIYDSSGAVIAYGCTTGCVAGDTNINMLGGLGPRLQDLLGTSASNEPSMEAKYLKPLRIQKEIDALQQRRSAAIERKANADARLLEATEKINNPPPCNVTGSAVVPMTPDQAESILADVDRKGGTR